jgi:hypothetical protein
MKGLLVKFNGFTCTFYYQVWSDGVNARPGWKIDYAC